MPRIRCAYEDCVFLDDHYCTAPQVEITPEQGCLTYKPLAEAEDLLDDWDDEDDLLDDDLLEDDDLWDDDF